MDISRNETQKLLRPMILAKALYAALETRRPALRKKIIDVLRENKSSLLMLNIVAKDSGDPEILFSLVPDLPKSELEHLLKAKASSPFGEISIATQPHRFTILYHQQVMKDLQKVLQQFLPFYEPGTDYKTADEMYQKQWYVERKGIKLPEWRSPSRGIPKEIITHIIPSYGKNGTDVLLALGQMKGYQNLAFQHTKIIDS